jgi:hypothetical protein
MSKGGSRDPQSNYEGTSLDLIIHAIMIRDALERLRLRGVGGWPSLTAVARWDSDPSSE